MVNITYDNITSNFLLYKKSQPNKNLSLYNKYQKHSENWNVNSHRRLEDRYYFHTQEKNIHKWIR